jgi:hypothetical protein
LENRVAARINEVTVRNTAIFQQERALFNSP